MNGVRPEMLYLGSDPKLFGASMRIVMCLAFLVAGCGTTHATIETSRGEELMLLGFDPVAYFTAGKPTRA